MIFPYRLWFSIRFATLSVRNFLFKDLRVNDLVVNLLYCTRNIIGLPKFPYEYYKRYCGLCGNLIAKQMCKCEEGFKHTKLNSNYKKMSKSNRSKNEKA